MKTYHIPCIWEMWGHLKVEANSLVEALDRAYDGPNPPGDYLDDSFSIDEIGVREYNKLTTEELDDLDTYLQEHNR